MVVVVIYFVTRGHQHDTGATSSTIHLLIYTNPLPGYTSWFVGSTPLKNVSQCTWHFRFLDRDGPSSCQGSLYISGSHLASWQCLETWEWSEVMTSLPSQMLSSSHNYDIINWVNTAIIHTIIYEQTQQLLTKLKIVSSWSHWLDEESVCSMCVSEICDSGALILFSDWLQSIWIQP